MTKPVEERPLFHITHVDNLRRILADGCLWSDFEMLRRANQRTVIGFDTIKKRRLEELRISCHPSTFVGHYVPFYFCPRSPMLYVIHRKNSELTYREGQDRIVHLVSKIGDAIEAASGRPWAFSDGNAGARYARFSNDLAVFDDFVDSKAVDTKYWSDPTIKERKQAEFLVHESFPWASVLAVGVIREDVANEVHRMLGSCDRPKVLVRPNWYY